MMKNKIILDEKQYCYSDSFLLSYNSTMLQYDFWIYGRFSGETLLKTVRKDKWKDH